MIKWLRKQSATTIGLIIVGIMLLIGIMLRWDYFTSEAAAGFKGLFDRPDTTNVIIKNNDH